jgi:hypothetical protein
MARIVYALNQSLHSYVDHMKIGPPDPALFRHFIEWARGLTDVVYGRRMYEIMRYWDDDQPDSDADDREFAAVWQSQRKWVVSRSLTSVGPNATLIGDDFEAVIRRLLNRATHETHSADSSAPLCVVHPDSYPRVGHCPAIFSPDPSQKLGEMPVWGPIHSVS